MRRALCDETAGGFLSRLDLNDTHPDSLSLNEVLWEYSAHPPLCSTEEINSSGFGV